MKHIYVWVVDRPTHKNNIIVTCRGPVGLIVKRLAKIAPRDCGSNIHGSKTNAIYLNVCMLGQVQLWILLVDAGWYNVGKTKKWLPTRIVFDARIVLTQTEVLPDWWRLAYGIFDPKFIQIGGLELVLWIKNVSDKNLPACLFSFVCGINQMYSLSLFLIHCR